MISRYLHKHLIDKCYPESALSTSFITQTLNTPFLDYTYWNSVRIFTSDFGSFSFPLFCNNLEEYTSDCYLIRMVTTPACLWYHTRPMLRS